MPDTLSGISTFNLLKRKYTARFRYGDPNTGFQYFEVEKSESNHRYQVKVRFAVYAPKEIFSVISGYCQCPKWHREGNCQHLLMAIYEQSKRFGMEQYFDYNKFAELNLAKSYLKEMEVAA